MRQKKKGKERGGIWNVQKRRKRGWQPKKEGRREKKGSLPLGRKKKGGGRRLT